MTVPSFTIVGYAWQILGRGGKKAPSHPWAAPKKPILNRVKLVKLEDDVLQLAGEATWPFAREKRNKIKFNSE